MVWKFEVPNTAVCIGLAGVTVLAVRRVLLFWKATCPSRSLMLGKTVVVTGANCGIGFETALELAHRKAHVILACRDLTKGQNAAKLISRKTGNQEVEAKQLDLSSFKSVRTFCADLNANLPKLDVLVNNAGVMNIPYSLTEDGLETHMSVNHFGNVLLSMQLLELLEKSASGRIVFVSSSLHKYGQVDLHNYNTEEAYKTQKPYASSKLMNLLLARELHQRVSENGKISVYSMHPGMVRTQLGRHSFMFNKYFKVLCFPLHAILYCLYVLLVKTAREGCQTVIYCALAPELEGCSDGYYGNFEKQSWSPKANDLDLAKKVYDLSLKVTGLK
ncbi:retinol dehydrogenase 12-like [Mya arenaria]|uniref:retinol dehydrogenase 12-like n=1 Tax=Mya arenaria TaxID=6604 RepID=UPI0022E30B7F|nr:retinol dehydrogenase 12-like [Mya arenaria]